jgi:O-antigen/teichoic acid export membrane protein/Mrp family chromosome partitioning ATPase
MDTLLTKEIARAPESSGQSLSTSLFLRLPFYILGFGGVAMWSWVSGYSADLTTLIIIIGISHFFWQCAFAFRATLEGLEQAKYISYAEIFSKLFNTVVALTLLFMGFGVVAIALVIVGVAFVHAAIQWVNLRQFARLNWRIDWLFARRMLRLGVPYMLSALFLAAYLQADAIIMERLLDDEAVGWYSAADSLFGTMLFVPTAFMGAVFPVLSRRYTNDRDSLPNIVQRSFNLMMVLGVPIGFGLAVIAQPLVLLIFGEAFRQSGPILAVLGIVVLLMYLTILLGKSLISADRQNAWTTIMVIATFATFGLDLVLIPLCDRLFGNGAIGGALAYVVTESGMVIAGLILMPKGTFGWSNFWVTLRAVAAGLLMVGAVWIVRDQFLLIPILIGALTYGGFAFLFNLFPKEDLRLFYQLIPVRIRRRLASRLRKPNELPSDVESVDADSGYVEQSEMFNRKKKKQTTKSTSNGYTENGYEPQKRIQTPHAPAQPGSRVPYGDAFSDEEDGYDHSGHTIHGAVKRNKKAEVRWRKQQRQRVLLNDQMSDVNLPLDLWDDDGHLLMRFSAEVVDNLRQMMTRLSSQTGEVPSRLALVSALPGEGTTYITRGLATVMAHDLAARIALVDLNWWSPAHPPIASSRNNGLVSVITGEKRLDEVFVRTALPNLTLIPAGRLERGDRPIMARSNVLKSALDVLSQHFDYLILDIPAVRATNDAVPLASLANGVVVVVRQGETPAESVRLALDEIQHLPILGTVLNHIEYHTPELLLRFIPQD